MKWGDPSMPPHFWDSCIPEPNTGCWIGLGRQVAGGYCQIMIAGVRMVAHRAAYIVVHGELPKHGDVDIELDHRCRTPCCRNPAHLDPVTHRENMLRGVSFVAVNAVAETCKRGHSLDLRGVVRTRTDGSLYRECLECGVVRRLEKKRSSSPRDGSSETSYLPGHEERPAIGLG